MRNTVGRMRSRLLVLCLTLGVSATAIAAPANVYDKYRNVSYSNQGLMREEDEIRLGQQAHQQVLQKYQLVRDPEVTRFVEDLGERIARRSKRPDLNYSFFVIDDPSVNAFALPGGFVYVNRGLLELAQSEDEIAAVLGHEVGHVVARHGLKNYKKAQRTALIFGGLGAAAEIVTRGSTGGRAASAAAQLLGAGILTKNSREYEREADYLGLYDLTSSGYSPDGMVRIFERLGQANGRSQSSIGGIFASHPDSRERIRNTQAEISQHLGRGQGQYDRAYGQEGSNDGRRRRVAGGDGGAFGDMKQALASYRSGGRRYGRDSGNRRNDPYGQRDPYGRQAPADPGDATYDPSAPPERPVLRRRPQQP